MTNDVLSELRILHEEICTSDGGECEMMALVRRGADEIERLRAHEHAAATILATALACDDYQPQHMEWMAEAARWLNEPRAALEPGVGVSPGQVIAYQNGKVEGLQAKLAEIQKWADAWSKPPASDASEADRGWYWAAQEVQNLLDPNPPAASRDASSEKAVYRKWPGEPPHCMSCDCGMTDEQKRTVPEADYLRIHKELMDLKYPGISPDSLVGALQDVVHTDPGPVRAGKAHRDASSKPLEQLFRMVPLCSCITHPVDGTVMVDDHCRLHGSADLPPTSRTGEQ